MTIYFSKPQNAGEAFRRVAQACGYGKPVQFCDMQDTAIASGKKFSLRRYNNGVNMQCFEGEPFVVSGPKQTMAKGRIPKFGYHNAIFKFMDGKVKLKDLLKDVYGSIIDKKWCRTDGSIAKEVLETLENARKSLFYNFDLKSLIKLAK